MPTDPGPHTAPAPPARPARLHQLDSLRGLAALSVVLMHLIINFRSVDQAPSPDPLWWFRSTPLHALWSGSEAVLLFFVLSGFVLSLPFHTRSVPYWPFAVRRTFRIYGAFAVGVTLALVVRTLTYGGPIAGLSDSFNRAWEGPLGWRDIALCYLLVPSFPAYKILPPVWSLVHEMRISLLFPVIMVLARIRPAAKALTTACLIGVAGVALTLVLKKLGWQQDYTMTLYYIPEFVVGAMMAGRRREIVERLRGLSSVQRGLLLAAALMLYTWRWWFLPSVQALHRITVFDDAFTVAGAALLMAVALASERLSSFLAWRVVVAVGLSSYSLYLVHQIGILGGIHAFYGHTPIWVPLLLSIPITVVCTWAVYRWVELPSIAAGRRVSDWLLRRAASGNGRAG